MKKHVQNIDVAFDDYLEFLERITQKPQAELAPQTVSKARTLFEAGDVQHAQEIILNELERQGTHGN